jgi:predicted small secreted protein
MDSTNTGKGVAGAWARGVAALAIVVAAMTLTACNTTEGVGKDVKSLGAGIEETAQDAKN